MLLEKKIALILFLLTFLLVKYDYGMEGDEKQVPHKSTATEMDESSNLITDPPSLLALTLRYYALRFSPHSWHTVDGEEEICAKLNKDLIAKIKTLSAVINDFNWKYRSQILAFQELKTNEALALIECSVLLEAALYDLKKTKLQEQFLYTLATIAINTDQGLPFLTYLASRGVNLGTLRKHLSYSSNRGGGRGHSKSNEWTLLHYIASKLPLLKMAQFLLNNGVDLHALDDHGQTALEAAHTSKRLHSNDPDYVLTTIMHDMLIKFLQEKQESKETQEEDPEACNLAEIINKAYLENMTAKSAF